MALMAATAPATASLVSPLPVVFIHQP